MLMGGIEPSQTGNYPECSCTCCLMVVNHSGQHHQYHQRYWLPSRTIRYIRHWLLSYRERVATYKLSSCQADEASCELLCAVAPGAQEYKMQLLLIFWLEFSFTLPNVIKNKKKISWAKGKSRNRTSFMRRRARKHPIYAPTRGRYPEPSGAHYNGSFNYGAV